MSESEAGSRINVALTVLLSLAAIIFCWALLNYVYNFSLAGYIGLVVPSVIYSVMPLLLFYFYPERFRTSIFLALFLSILVFLNYNQLLFGIDLNAARPIIKAVWATPGSEQLEQLRRAAETSPKNRVLRVAYEVRLQQNSAQKEIAALLSRIEQPMFGVHSAPLAEMSREELQSFVSYLTDAKQAALSADKDLESILNNLHTQIRLLSSTLGSSSIVNAYNSYILSLNDDQALTNINVFGPYFSAVAKLYSCNADAAEFILTHKNHKNENGNRSFDDPSDNVKYSAIVSQQQQYIDELKEEIDVVNNTKGIYTNALRLEDKKI
jgi:hypothetical protein